MTPLDQFLQILGVEAAEDLLEAGFQIVFGKQTPVRVRRGRELNTNPS